jgi:hypothetical protein
LLLNVRRIQPHVRQQAGLWLTIEDAMEAAIPTPVRKLLAGLRKSA